MENTHAVLVLKGRKGERDQRERRNRNGDHLQLRLSGFKILPSGILFVLRTTILLLNTLFACKHNLQIGVLMAESSSFLRSKCFHTFAVY